MWRCEVPVIEAGFVHRFSVITVVTTPLLQIHVPCGLYTYQKTQETLISALFPKYEMI